jgi:hypothetical protein
VLRVLAEVQCGVLELPQSAASLMLMIAGEAFNGYSLDTPRTTARCQRALASAEGDEDDGEEVEAEAGNAGTASDSD